MDWALKTYGLLVLNLLHNVHSSLGFKHSEETKKKLSEIGGSRKHSEETKKKLSAMFSGKLNPFWGRSHTPEFKLSRSGKLNPMYGKVTTKSPEFLAHQGRKLMDLCSNLAPQIQCTGLKNRQKL